MTFEKKLPTCANFRRGKTFENKVARHLRNQGAMVLRTNWNQKDVDLVAIWGIDISELRDELPWLVQCKKSRLATEEWQRLVNLARRFGSHVNVKAAIENEKGFITFIDIQPTEIQLPPEEYCLSEVSDNLLPSNVPQQPSLPPEGLELPLV